MGGATPHGEQLQQSAAASLDRQLVVGAFSGRQQDASGHPTVTTVFLFTHAYWTNPLEAHFICCFATSRMSWAARSTSSSVVWRPVDSRSVPNAAGVGTCSKPQKRHQQSCIQLA